MSVERGGMVSEGRVRVRVRVRVRDLGMFGLELIVVVADALGEDEEGALSGAAHEPVRNSAVALVRLVRLVRLVTLATLGLRVGLFGREQLKGHEGEGESKDEVRVRVRGGRDACASE